MYNLVQWIRSSVSVFANYLAISINGNLIVTMASGVASIPICHLEKGKSARRDVRKNWACQGRVMFQSVRFSLRYQFSLVIALL